MASNMHWRWLETANYGGQDGSVLTKLFKGKDNLSAEDLLAREVTQNSWDAARVVQSEHPEKTIHFSIRFRFKTLTGLAKSDFIRAAGPKELAERRPSVKAGNGLESESVLSTSESETHLSFSSLKTTALMGYMVTRRR